MPNTNVRGFSYDVALSFAGEDRDVVERLARILKDNGVSVFYDDWERPDLWGKDLYQHLAYVYGKAARFCIVFISQNYAQKSWTSHELRSAQERAFQQNSEYILPVRLDDTELQGITGTIGYIDLRSRAVEELANLVLAKLQAPPGSPPTAPAASRGAKKPSLFPRDGSVQLAVVSGLPGPHQPQETRDGRGTAHQRRRVLQGERRGGERLCVASRAPRLHTPSRARTSGAIRPATK